MAPVSPFCRLVSMALGGGLLCLCGCPISHRDGALLQGSLGTELRLRPLQERLRAYRRATAEANREFHRQLTPLMWASRCGDADAVRALLASGALPNAADADGCTALHHGVECRDTRVLRLLLDHGANPDGAPGAPETPLNLTCYGESWPAGARMLVATGADVNRPGPAGVTPLMLTDNASLAAFFLAHGADPNRRNSSGLTALIYAVLHNNPERVSLLLRRGADPKLRDSAGKTAVEYASERGFASLVAILQQ